MTRKKYRLPGIRRNDISDSVLISSNEAHLGTNRAHRSSTALTGFQIVDRSACNPWSNMRNSGTSASSIISSRLLCVDDDERFLKVFTSFLKELGFEALSTSDPDKALELTLASPSPDLAILDLQMPRCTGTELASILKTLKPDLPIVIFSGSPDVTTIKSPSVDAIFSKGQHLAGLIAKIDELVLAKPRGLLLAAVTHHDSQ